MKRIFNLGDLKVEYSDLGLDFYSSSGSHMWLNKKSTEELIKIISRTDFEYERYTKNKIRKQKLSRIK